MNRLTVGVNGFCRRWMIPTGRTRSGIASGTTLSVRIPTSFWTVCRGRIDTPAAIVIACLIVSILSNSMTVVTLTLCARSARSIALRIVSPESNATNVSPLRSVGRTRRWRASRWFGWHTNAMGSARSGTIERARFVGG